MNDEFPDGFPVLGDQSPLSQKPTGKPYKPTRKANQSAPVILGCAVVLAAVPLMCCMSMFNHKSVPKDPNAFQATEAEIRLRSMLLKEMPDVEIGSIDFRKVPGRDRWVTYSYVEGKNAFGGTVRKRFTSVADRQGKLISFEYY